MRCGLGLGHEDMIRRCRAASQPPDETHRGCPRRAPGASHGTAREICGAVAGMGRGLSVRARGSGLLVWCSFGQVVGWGGRWCCCWCGACRSGGAVRPGRGGGVRRTATPRCSGRAEPIKGRADSLSGRTRGDVGAAPGLAAQGARWGCCGRILVQCSPGGRVVAKAVGSGSASASIRAILKGGRPLKCR